MNKLLICSMLVVFVSGFSINVASIGRAQDFCKGDFAYDGDVDGSDAALFKSDFGRCQFQNPCPACTMEA